MIKKILMWIGIIFVVLIVIAMFAGNNDSTHTQNETQATSNKQEQVTEKALEVTAKELTQAYEKNEISANQQYKDKWLLVTGVVDSITADFRDKPVIKLQVGQYSFNGPTATLAESDEARAGELSKGQSVKLLCLGAGEVISSPSLKKCTFQ